MRLYHNIDELNRANQRETLLVAHRMGYDTHQNEENGHVLCGRHGSEELLDIYPDGSWEVPGKPISGDSAAFLKILAAVGEDEYQEATAS